MAPANVLALVHGMVPDPAPSSPFAQYEAFWQALLREQPGLGASVARRVGVQWGHEMPQLTSQALATAVAWGYQPPAVAGRLRPDERLTDAQVYIGARVGYSSVRSDTSPQNEVLGGPFGADSSVLFFLRQLVEGLRENILLRGFGDAVYYGSSEGEKLTRLQVYGQILTQVDALNAPEVRLHIVGHSLGATVAHDLLYGLFAQGHSPDFIQQARNTQARQLFEKWRQKAQGGQLTLGSFVTMGSQLPLFVMRTQRLVDTLAANTILDPTVLGISTGDTRPRWINFYDIDDLLGFPTRRLYQECPALVEVQVDSGDMPDRAHIDYWITPAVIERTASLLAANCV